MSLVNNVKTVLNANVAIAATTIQAVKASAPYNDPPTSGTLTLMDSLVQPTKIEVISYTGRTDNTTYWTLTGVSKAQESTSDQSWSSGDDVIMALTVGELGNIAIDGGAF